MARVSDGKSEKLYFQMDRFVQQNGEWFYMTREGGEKGPFVSRDDAEGDIAVYIRQQLKLHAFGG